MSFKRGPVDECPVCGSTAFNSDECEDCGTNYRQALRSITEAMHEMVANIGELEPVK